MKKSLFPAFLLLIVSLETTKGQNIDFSRCGRIFCYQNPSGCTAATCTYGVTIETDDTQATITLTTNQGGMVALGFSDDRSMGEDDVVGCYRESGGAIKPVDSWNPGGYTANRPDTTNNLAGNSMGSYANGVLQCQIVRNLTTGDTSEDRDWKQSWYLLYPYSTGTGPGSGSGLPAHLAKPVRSDARIDITAIPDLVDFSRCNEVYCYRSPSDCTSSSTCTYSVRIETDSTQATIVLSASAGGMVALGFSDDRSMGEDDVVGCYRTSSDAVIAVDAWNPGGYTENRLDSTNNLDSVRSFGVYRNGAIECRIVRNLTTGDTSEDRDWKQLWYLLYPYSTNTGSGGGLPVHSVRPVRSDARVDITSSMTTQAPTTPAPPPSRTVDINFDNCENLFCYRNLADCNPETCTYGVTVETDDTKATIKLTTNLGGFIALGFSQDRNMGQDDVVGCVRTGGSTVIANDAWNPGGRSPNEADDTNNLDQSNSFGTYIDGVLQCQIVRNLISTDTTQDYNWTGNWTLLYPYSSDTGSSSGAFPKHSATPLATSEPVDISQQNTAGAASAGVSIGFVKAHGIMMIIAWIGLASTGILLARYFKPVFPNDKPVCCFSGTPAAWFQLHRIHMISTLLLTIVAFIIIFVGVKDWTASGGDGLRAAHPILGVIVVALAIAQPVMAAFRCAPDAENRYIFNWAHSLVGLTALFLGIINVHFGIHIADNQFSNFLNGTPVYVLIAWVVTAAIFYLVLEILSRLNRGNSTEEIEMKGKAEADTSSPEGSDGCFWKKFILINYMAISLGFALSAIIIIGVNNP